MSAGGVCDAATRSAASSLPRIPYARARGWVLFTPSPLPTRCTCARYAPLHRRGSGRRGAPRAVPVAVCTRRASSRASGGGCAHVRERNRHRQGEDREREGRRVQQVVLPVRAPQEARASREAFPSPHTPWPRGAASYCVSVKALMTSVSVKPTVIELDEVGKSVGGVPRTAFTPQRCSLSRAFRTRTRWHDSRACAHSRGSRDAGCTSGADQAAHRAERVRWRQARWRQRWCVPRVLCRSLDSP